MSWWRRWRRHQQVEAQLDKELRFHLDRRMEELMANGMAPSDARRQASLNLGGLEQVKEKCRDTRGMRWLEDLAQDVRYGLRAMRRQLGFAVVALLTLALGIGATTVMFTVINSVLLRPLAYPEPQRLVSLHEQPDKYSASEWSFSYLNFLDCQRESQSVSIAAWRNHGGAVSEPGEAEFVPGGQISANLFSVYGLPLLRGRAFLPDEDRAGGTPVAVVSYRLWQNRYGGGNSAIGGRLVYEGMSYTVVGVAPHGFQLSGTVDVFTPLGQYTAPTMQNREMHPGISAVGRLRAGATLAKAQAEMALIGRQLAMRYPKANAGRSIQVKPLRAEIVGDVRPTLWLLLGAVTLVLLVACVNVASLLLARALSRQRELAMRVALGASRGRLARQYLTEGGLLAVCGGALGVGLAAFGVRPFLFLWPGGLPRAAEVHLDWRVLLFTLATSLLSGLLFALAPALRSPSRSLEQALHTGARSLASVARRWHKAFVIAEIALAVVLLIAAGMLGRTVLRLSGLDPGFNPHNVLAASVALSSAALTSPARIRAAWDGILERLEHTPGVEAVGVADVMPMGPDTEEVGYWTTPNTPPVNQMPMSQMSLVTPGYLAAVGIPLRAGRFFTAQDRAGGEPVVVIDEVLKQRAFGGRDPIGQRLSLQFIGPARVIGVAGHVRHWGLDADDDASIREQLYLPYAWLPDEYVRLTASGMTLLVRTRIPPLNVVESVRRQVRGAVNDQPIYEIRSMERVVIGTLGRQRFLLLLFGIFAGLALLLACIGIYGVLAYLAGQRVPEIGVRLALGAGTHSVLWMILRQSLGMILVGAALGLAAALGSARLLTHLVSGMRPAEPATLSLVLAVLVGAALLASYLPARRASRVDPVRALRQE